MKLVVDANIPIAMLIRPGIVIDLFLNKKLKIFAPYFLYEELLNNKDLIVKKSSVPEEDVNELLAIILAKIEFVKDEEYYDYYEIAKRCCPDPKDTAYFALALYLDCGLWTNEKRLKEQDNVEVFHTHELLKKIKT